MPDTISSHDPKATEGLHLSLWKERFVTTAERLRAEHWTIEQALRHAFHLMQIAPEEVEPLLDTAVDEAEYERALERGDFASAAIMLCATAQVEKNLTVDADRTCVELVCSRFNSSASAHGSDESTATLLAFASVMTDICDRLVSVQRGSQDQGQRKHRSGQHRQSSEQ